MSAPHHSQEGPSLDRLYSIRLDGSRRFLHPADVKGRFITRRRLVFAVLMVVYLALPIIQVGGHPAVHLDVPERRFHLFGQIYNSQDFWIVVFILTAVAFSLLFFTAWLGRVWCGWACPQTVFLEGIYRPVERFFEGSRAARIKLEAAPWTLGKIARKVGKHLAFLAVSMMVAHVTLSLFVSGRSLFDMVRHSPAQHRAAFLWMLAVTGGFYFNFAWFREQMCIVICPYGRMQSVLTDRDSLLVGYDTGRGEPRGKAGRAAGDCVDCYRCVAVCPTGIDIRDGLQMECIGCTQCIDACDEIMVRLKRPTGLIRYDSQNGFEGRGKSAARPRLFVYGTLLAVAVIGFGVSAAMRTTFEANLIRTRGAPWVIEDSPAGATVRNQYELHLINKHPVPATFRLQVSTPQGVKADYVVPQREVKLAPLESMRLPIFVKMERAAFHGPFDVTVRVSDGTAGHSPQARQVRARFLGPQGGT